MNVLSWKSLPPLFLTNILLPLKFVFFFFFLFFSFSFLARRLFQGTGRDDIPLLFRYTQNATAHAQTNQPDMINETKKEREKKLADGWIDLQWRGGARKRDS